MNARLNAARDRVASWLLNGARRWASDEGWGRMLHGLGAPNMQAGLTRLRDSGVQLTAVVDGGACLGHWTALLRRVFPQVRVLMIEPQTRHAAVLQQRCREWAPGVEFAGTLVGAQPAPGVPFVVLDDDSGGTGSSVMAENSDVPRHVETLPMTTLDRLLEERRFPPPELVKLDVQGYELEVLKGASRVLAQAEFVLLEVSLWPYNAGSPLLNETLAWMDGAGYRAYEIFDLSRRPDGVLVQVDILFVRKDSPRLRDALTRFDRR